MPHPKEIWRGVRKILFFLLKKIVTRKPRNIAETVFLKAK